MALMTDGPSRAVGAQRGLAGAGEAIRRPQPAVALDQGTVAPVTGWVGADREVGTTTLAVLVASRVASRARVVCIDADYDRRDVERGVVDGWPKVLDALVGAEPVFAQWQVAAAMLRDPSGAWLLPLPDAWARTPDTPDDALARLIAYAGATVERVVVDLGHRIDGLRASALGMVDRVVIVLAPETPPERVADLVRAVSAAGVPARAIRFVCNRVASGGLRDDALLAALPEAPASVDALWSSEPWSACDLADGTFGAGIDALARWVVAGAGW